MISPQVKGLVGVATVVKRSSESRTQQSRGSNCQKSRLHLEYVLCIGGRSTGVIRNE